MMQSGVEPCTKPESLSSDLSNLNYLAPTYPIVKKLSSVVCNCRRYSRMPSAESLLPAGEGSSSADSGRPKGIRKINDAVYLLSEPEGRKPDIEIVFIHGLQFIDHSDAFWKTWTAATKDQDGKEVCWPMAWLAEDFPGARMLSISYDSSAIETPETGRIDLFLAGESLVQSMVDLADVGQHGCPIVFVCHSLGGLVAKQIVLNAHRKFSKERKYVDFLNNIEGFHFYATTHSGSKLANLASCLPIWNKGPMTEILKVINDDRGRLNEEFDRFVSDMYPKEWKFAVVAETHKTRLYGFNAKLVEETSARYTYNKFISVQVDHFEVCKPESKVRSSYLYLRNFLVDIVQQNVLRNSNVWGLPSFLVGMEDRLAEVTSKLEVHSRVGLVGMGGIGKTTLTKHLYNQKIRHFDKCCFLEDVKFGDIKASQKKLITDLCGYWNEKEHMNLQLNCAREYIMTKEVLLVVDDVGSEENLKALLVDAFQDGHIGSKVIVTTRRQDILIGCMGREGIIDLDFLNEDQALQLFSHYAFGELGTEDRVQLDGVLREITKSCNGLPLSIEVIGQFLKKFNEPQFAHERMDIWKGALEKLQKAESLDGSRDDKLWATLKISYDDLDEHLQSLFVDFACILGESLFLYDSWEKKNLMELKDKFGRIWGDAIGIHNLISRSLIKWNPEENVIVMHDQLCDLGRSIGNTNRIRCRGALKSDDYQNLEWHKMSLKIFRFLLEIFQEAFLETFYHDIRFRHLRFGPLDIILFTGAHWILFYPQWYMVFFILETIFIYILNSLILFSYFDTICVILGIILRSGVLWIFYYLRWYMLCPIWGIIVLVYISTSFDLFSYFDPCNTWEESEGLKLMQQNKGSETLKGLLFLNVPRKQFSRIQKRWENRSREKKCIESLRLLNLRGSHVGVVEYFLSFHLSELTWLCLSQTRITHRSIRLLGDSCSKLRVLEMVGCGKLTKLPECIGHLSDLRELDLSRCRSLRSLPNSIGQLKRLQVLYLRSCYSLKRLPLSLGHLSQLKHLHLDGCRNLVELPSTVGDLSQLCTMSLSGCTVLKRLPESFGKLSCLQLLDISRGVHLQWGAEHLNTRLQQLEDGGCNITHCGAMVDCRHCTWHQPCPVPCLTNSFEDRSYDFRNTILSQFLGLILDQYFDHLYRVWR
ncbi:hypothetical protein M758_6G147700 [Ceratodon purpureus]|nr:hypothetical protein M758_6G147700 [Ceratodon purpureus]